MIKIIKNKKCFTLGFSTMKMDEFISILKDNKINCIIDVRSVPYSKFASQFNKDNIKKILKDNKIIYSNFSKEFGARRNDSNLYDNEGILDFNLVINSQEFRDGVNRVKIGIKKGFRIAITCSEKRPLDCHRFSMVSKGLMQQGVEVFHILEDKKVVSTKFLENRMIEKLNIDNNNVNQLTLNGEKSKDKNSIIREAYTKLNKKVGYSEKQGDL